MGERNQKYPFFILGLLAGFVLFHFLSPLISPVVVTSVFSPDNSNLILEHVNSAQKSIDMEMYLITSQEMLSALKRAHDRGIIIRVILEESVIANDNGKSYRDLIAYGIDTKWASGDFQLTHSKFLVIDGKKVIVGSHNWSDAAMKKNREASVIIEQQKTVQEFETIFEGDWNKAG